MAMMWVYLICNAGRSRRSESIPLSTASLDRCLLSGCLGESWSLCRFSIPTSNLLVALKSASSKLHKNVCQSTMACLRNSRTGEIPLGSLWTSF